MNKTTIYLILLSAFIITACGGTSGGKNRDASAQNTPPAIEGQTNVSLAEGVLDVTQLTASDLDGDAVSLSLNGIDANAFTIANSGLLRFKRKPDFENPTDADKNNIYIIDISASDGKNVTTINCIITVEDIDEDNTHNSDQDNDGVKDSDDAFPNDPSESLDTDNDGQGNNADPDDDNDGRPDTSDKFPLNSNEWDDTDNDGIGNNQDTDDDNDGVSDESDDFPLDPTESRDTDNDGIGDNSDPAPEQPYMHITIKSPELNAIVGSELTITVEISSDLDVSSVEASLEGYQTELTFKRDAICTKAECFPGFVGMISANTLISGTYTLRIDAEDVQSRSAQQTTKIVLDRKPELVIQAPTPFSVARPILPISTHCIDDNGNCTIVVSIDGKVASSSENTLSDELDLSKLEGTSTVIQFSAKDNKNQSVSTNISVYVESSTALKAVQAFEGKILDFDGTRVLHLYKNDDDEKLFIQQLGTTNKKQVLIPNSYQVNTSNAYLTTTGAIFVASTGSSTTARLFDWNMGELIDLGKPNSTSSLVVAGDYAIWNVSTALFRRTFSSKTNITIANDAGNWKNDVAANGNVTYWDTKYQINLYNNDGVIISLTDDTAYWNVYTITDGNLHVYRKQTNNPKSYAIAVHNTENETFLTQFSEIDYTPRAEYQVMNGWVAYSKIGGLGQSHVWVRSPSGSEYQLTFYGNSSSIDKLSDYGETAIINDNSRYLVTLGNNPRRTNSSLGKAYSNSGVWYLTIGRELFQIEE
jgi:hypothetical protein